jgi:hypothetical protein
MDLRAMPAILRAVFSRALVSAPDRKARESIAQLEQVASARLAANSDFEEAMRRVVGDLSK